VGLMKAEITQKRMTDKLCEGYNDLFDRLPARIYDSLDGQIVDQVWEQVYIPVREDLEDRLVWNWSANYMNFRIL